VRPKSIRNFELLYISAWLVGVLGTAILLPRSSQGLLALPFGRRLGLTLYVTVTVVGFLLPLIAWFFAARRASWFAKWFLVVLLAIQGLGLLRGLAIMAIGPDLIGGLAVLNIILKAAAVRMLFQPDARTWFGELTADPAATTENPTGSSPLHK
jgi:hypothetical protein